MSYPAIGVHSWRKVSLLQLGEEEKLKLSPSGNSESKLESLSSFLTSNMTLLLNQILQSIHMSRDNNNISTNTVILEITWFGYLHICYGKENKKCNVNNKEAAPSFDSIHSKHNPIIGINKFHQHSVINSSQSGRQPQAQSISIRTIEKLSKTVNPLNPDFLSPFYPFFHHWNFTKFCQKLTLKWNEDESILELTIDAPNHPNPESILDVSVYKYDLSSPVKHSNAPQVNISIFQITKIKELLAFDY